MRDAAAIACLLLTGFAGLVYEVCWIREAALVFGSTTFATSTVLGVFFCGLALGSEAFGRAAERTARPLRVFAALELAIGVLALASPWAFEHADAAYGPVYRAFAGSPVPLFGARAMLVALVVLPPAVLMGGSLPLFCRRYAARGGGVAGPVGLLYAVNTGGAAIGCIAAGFWLIPQLGVSGAVRAGVACNVAAGVAALCLRERPRAPAPAAATGHEGARERLLACVLFFAVGLVALGAQVVWTRYLALLVRNTVHTFTLTLAVALVGIVIGSALAARSFARARSPGFAFGALQAATGIWTLATAALPPAVWERLGGGLAVYAALLLPPAILSGASFPLAVRLIVSDPERLGIGAGRAAAVNTLGGITGSLAAGFAGLPLLGLSATLRLLTGTSLVVALVAWTRLAAGVTPRLRLLVGASATLLWLAIPSATGTRLPADFLGRDEPLVAYREGLASNVAVVRGRRGLQLEIDRWWQGEERKNHQIMAAHLPMLLHRDPRRVLVVGAGAGQTAARFLLYDIERLEVADLEPAVFGLIRSHFDAAWMDDPRVALLMEDGRNHLAHTGRHYDVISLEVGQLFRPGAAWLYTVEFYERARQRLAAGGLLSQMLPLPFLTPEQLRSAIATFRHTFPHSTLWYNTAELLLVGVNGGGVAAAPERLALLDEDADVRSDLRWSHWGGPERWLQQRENLLAGFLAGPDGLARLARGAPLVRDDPPILEYAMARVSPAATYEIASTELLRAHLDAVGPTLGLSIPPDAAQRIARAREENLRHMEASALVRKAERLRDRAPRESAALLDEAIARQPRHVEANRLRADAFLREERLPQARAAYERALALDGESAAARRGLALVLHRLGLLDEAIDAYRAALESWPDDAEAHNALGVALAQRGDLTAAREHFRRALEIRPDFSNAAANLARADSAAR